MAQRMPRERLPNDPQSHGATDAHEAAALVREMLDASDVVDAERIDVVARADGSIVLRGWVAGPEERERALLLADELTGNATPVLDELQVDPGLREGVQRPVDAVPAPTPAEEIPVGGIDMLAGPDGAPTEDVGRAFEENEPWSPPDAPTLPNTPSGHPTTIASPDARDELVLEADTGPAAADLTRADLSSPSNAPSLDEQRIAHDNDDEALREDLPDRD